MTLGIVMAILLDGFSKYINIKEDEVDKHNKEVLNEDLEFS